MTAIELLALLQSDPEFARNNEEREISRGAFEAELSVEETPILSQLADAGVRVASVWDLVNTTSSYVAAIPVLTKHLRLPYHPKIREGIVRALTVREAQSIAGRVILDELKRGTENSWEVRWALANALTVVGDISMKEEIESLVSDVRYSDERTILNLALKKLRAHF